MTEHTRGMTGGELEQIRESMGFDKRSMAALLGWDYSTYQKRAYGTRGIPADAAEQVRSAQKHDRELTACIQARTVERIHRDYPQGIPSAPLDIDETT